MEPPQAPAPRCVNLQSKSLIVHGEGAGDAPDRDELTDCWCVQTARPLGPDNRRVGLRECRDPDRDCYREY